MQDSDNRPETLLRVSTDMEAAMIVSTLAGEEIDATSAGDFTAGFRAEAPGMVSVLVRHSDLERARGVLAEIKSSPVGGAPQASDNSSKPWHLVGLLLAPVAAWVFLTWLLRWR
jgi:hypothetical protein